jgi:archaellum component FlaG (FlaF/FlaG flagellin family)
MLIVITVASGAVAYVFIEGYISTSAPATPTSSVSVDNVNKNDVNDNVTLYVRNTGSSNVTVDYVYVYTGGSLMSANDVNVVIPSGTVGTVVINGTGIGHDRSYNFQVVCSGNTMTATFNSYV